MNLTGRRLRFSGAAMGVLLLGAGLVTSMNLGSAHADTTGGFHTLQFNLTQAAGSVYIVGIAVDASPVSGGECYHGPFPAGVNVTPIQLADGTDVTVESFASPDCTDSLQETLKATVPQTGGDATYFTVG